MAARDRARAVHIGITAEHKPDPNNVPACTFCPVRVLRLDSRRQLRPGNAWTVKLIDLIKLNYQTVSGFRRIDCFSLTPKRPASDKLMSF